MTFYLLFVRLMLHGNIKGGHGGVGTYEEVRQSLALPGVGYM